MNFKAERVHLLRALAHIHSVAEKRNTIPILANVLLTHDGKSLSLTGTDMEIAVVEEIPAIAGRPGSATVPVSVLFEIVRKLPDGIDIEFEQSSPDAPLTLRAGRYATELNILPVDDFPAMVAGDLPHNFRIPVSTLRLLIDRTKFAMSNEETRYYLNGIYLHVGAGKAGPTLRSVATDGHRLALVDADLPVEAKKIPGVIIPRKTVMELRKLLDENDAEVEISLSETRIQFKVASVILTSKLVDGTFPEYERVIPRNNKRILHVTKQDLGAAVGRVAAISQERSRPVKLSLSKNHLTLSAISPDQGMAQEELDDKSVTYDAEPLEIGFQARYLTDITDQIEAEAEFSFADSASPALIQDTQVSFCFICAYADSCINEIILRLDRLTLTDFRNYKRTLWEPSAPIAVITGENGSGKTNLLEAISLLTPGRGLRNAPIGHLCRQGASHWGIAAHLISNGQSLQLSTGTPSDDYQITSSPSQAGSIKNARRIFQLDGEAVRQQSTIAALSRCVWLTPQMDRLFTESPSGRRRFFDRLIMGVYPEHASQMAAHERSVMSRNRLLSASYGDPSWLDAIEESISRHAVAATAARLSFIERMNDRSLSQLDFPHTNIEINCDIAQLLRQKPALYVEDWLRDQLKKTRHEDSLKGYASLGAHRCDMTLIDYMTQRPAVFSSSGQQKLMFLDVILQHAALVTETWGDAPFILLDEPLIHLDEQKRRALLTSLDSLKTSIFMTGTEEAPFSSLKK